MKAEDLVSELVNVGDHSLDGAKVLSGHQEQASGLVKVAHTPPSLPKRPADGMVERTPPALELLQADEHDVVGHRDVSAGP